MGERNKIEQGEKKLGEKCRTQIVLQYYVLMYIILCFNRSILHIYIFM